MKKRESLNPPETEYLEYSNTSDFNLQSFFNQKNDLHNLSFDSNFENEIKFLAQAQKNDLIKPNGILSHFIDLFSGGKYGYISTRTPEMFDKVREQLNKQQNTDPKQSTEMILTPPSEEKKAILKKRQKRGFVPFSEFLDGVPSKHQKLEDSSDKEDCEAQIPSNDLEQKILSPNLEQSSSILMNEIKVEVPSEIDQQDIKKEEIPQIKIEESGNEVVLPDSALFIHELIKQEQESEITSLTNKNDSHNSAKTFEQLQDEKLNEYKMLDEKKGRYNFDKKTQLIEKQNLQQVLHRCKELLESIEEIFGIIANQFSDSKESSTNSQDDHDQIVQRSQQGFKKFERFNDTADQLRKAFDATLKKSAFKSNKCEMQTDFQEWCGVDLKALIEDVLMKSSASKKGIVSQIKNEMQNVKEWVNQYQHQATNNLEELLKVNFWPKKYKYTREKGPKDKQAEIEEEMEQNKLLMQHNKEMLFEVSRKKFEVDKGDHQAKREYMRLENYLIKRHQDERKLSKKLQLHNQMKNYIMYAIRFISQKVAYPDPKDVTYHRLILKSFHLSYNKSDLQALTTPYEPYTIERIQSVIALENCPREKFKYDKHFIFQKEMINQYLPDLFQELSQQENIEVKQETESKDEVQIVKQINPIPSSVLDLTWEHIMKNAKIFELFNKEVCRIKQFNEQNRIYMQIFCIQEYPKIILGGKGNKIDHLYGNQFILSALRFPQIIQL